MLYILTQWEGKLPAKLAPFRCTHVTFASWPGTEARNGSQAEFPLYEPTRLARRGRGRQQDRADAWILSFYILRSDGGSLAMKDNAGMTTLARARATGNSSSYVGGGLSERRWMGSEADSKNVERDSLILAFPPVRPA